MTIGETDVVGEVRWSPLLNMAGRGRMPRPAPQQPHTQPAIFGIVRIAHGVWLSNGGNTRRWR